MKKKSIDYMLSLSLLKQLKSQNLITEEEFTKIDLLNKKSFNSP
ncbi:SHOCT domain-containing protein [Paenibacillus sp. A3]